jgi:hypothetical protein
MPTFSSISLPSTTMSVLQRLVAFNEHLLEHYVGIL